MNTFTQSKNFSTRFWGVKFELIINLNSADWLSSMEEGNGISFFWPLTNHEVLDQDKRKRYRNLLTHFKHFCSFKIQFSMLHSGYILLGFHFNYRMYNNYYSKLSIPFLGYRLIYEFHFIVSRQVYHYW